MGHANKISTAYEKILKDLSDLKNYFHPSEDYILKNKIYSLLENKEDGMIVPHICDSIGTDDDLRVLKLIEELKREKRVVHAKDSKGVPIFKLYHGEDSKFLLYKYKTV